MNRIYATSFKRTGLSFPLVWARNDKSVSAVNVTDRYRALGEKKNCRIQVFDREGGSRVAVDLVIRCEDEVKGRGRSRDETRDTNDMLDLFLPPGKTYVVEVEAPDGRKVTRSFEVEEGEITTVNVYLYGS